MTDAVKPGRIHLPLDIDFTGCPETVTVGKSVAFDFLDLCSYCKRHMTDGVIPRAVAQRLAIEDTSLTAMATVGWVTLTSTLVTIVSWADWNPTKDQVKDGIQRRAERNRRHRDKLAAERAAEKSRDLALSTSELEDRDRDRDRDRSGGLTTVSETVSRPSHPTSGNGRAGNSAARRMAESAERVTRYLEQREQNQ